MAVLALMARLAGGSSAAVDEALEAQVSAKGVRPEVVQFYQLSSYRPLWIRSTGVPPIWSRPALSPAAKQMAAVAARALPSEFPVERKAWLASAVARAESGQPADLARAEVALSTAMADMADRLATAPAAAQLEFVDPDLHIYAAARDALEQAGGADDLGYLVRGMANPNPIYADLRRQYDAYRQAWAAGGHSGPPPNAALIEANLARARALPPPPGHRFILVNPASGELSFYENNKVTHSMKVVVGKTDEPTPAMAGLMRYLVFNPYWEVPDDMVRTSIAKHALTQPGFMQAGGFQALSDFSETAVPVSPASIDWRAVIAGAADVPVRQVPGGSNMMGRVKFMMPNELGIYLHDTPDKWLFHAPHRLYSAGCVRLERAQDLVGWLLGKKKPDPNKLGPNTKVELDEHVPVYTAYLTAAPGPKGIAYYPDVYGRDPVLLAALFPPKAAHVAPR